MIEHSLGVRKKAIEVWEPDERAFMGEEVAE